MDTAPPPQLSGPERLEKEHIVLQRLGQLYEVQWLSFYGQPSMFAQLKTELLLPPRASPLPLGKSRTFLVWSPALDCRTGPFPYPSVLPGVQRSPWFTHIPQTSTTPAFKGRKEQHLTPSAPTTKPTTQSPGLPPQPVTTTNIQPHSLPLSLSSRLPALFRETSWMPTF